MATEMDYIKQRRSFSPKFHPELLKLMACSRALMHPSLLPDRFPIYLSVKQKIPFLPSEEK